MEINNQDKLPNYLIKFFLKYIFESFNSSRVVLITFNENPGDFKSFIEFNRTINKIGLVCKEWLKYVRYQNSILFDTRLYEGYQKSKEAIVQDYDPTLKERFESMSQQQKFNIQRVLVTRYFNQVNFSQFSNYCFNNINTLVMNNDLNISSYLNMKYEATLNNFIAIEAIRFLPNLKKLIFQNYQLNVTFLNYAIEATRRCSVHQNYCNIDEGKTEPLKIEIGKLYIYPNNSLNDINSLFEKLNIDITSIKTIYLVHLNNFRLFLNVLKTFHKSWEELYIIGGYKKIIPFRILGGNISQLIKYTLSNPYKNNDNDNNYSFNNGEGNIFNSFNIYNNFNNNNNNNNNNNDDIVIKQLEVFNQMDTLNIEGINYFGNLKKLMLLHSKQNNHNMTIDNIYYSLAALPSTIEHYSISMCFTSFNYYLASSKEKELYRFTNCKCNSLLPYYDEPIQPEEFFKIHWLEIKRMLEYEKPNIEFLEIRSFCNDSFSLYHLSQKSEFVSKTAELSFIEFLSNIQNLKKISLSNFSTIYQDYFFKTLNQIRLKNNLNTIIKVIME